MLPEQLSKETMKDLDPILKPVIMSLTKGTIWLGDFSIMHHFCWGIINNCCSKISISYDDLSWARNRGPIINTLCQIFFHACHEFQMPKVLMDSIPDIIQQHSSKDLLRYVDDLELFVNKVSYITSKFEKKNISISHIETKVLSS